MGGDLRSLPQDLWAVILAGGDGLRLRPLTRIIAGDDRPKQFCPIVGEETLLDRTRRRVALLVPSERTLLVLTQTHAPFYPPLLACVGSTAPVIQPENKGTAPAILYALLRIAAVAPEASLALFPSDHYVSDDPRFMSHVETAFRLVAHCPELVTLLGITADSPETEYGWIEPAELVYEAGAGTVHRARRFCEKPSLAVAEALWRLGCLWNSFVMVARVSRLLSMFGHALPDLSRIFADLQASVHTPAENESARAVYGRIPETNFSSEVLARYPADLAVLSVTGVRWSDWGNPARVLTTLARDGIRPRWAEASLCIPA